MDKPHQNPVQPALDACQAQLQAMQAWGNAMVTGIAQIDQIVLEAAKEGLHDQLAYAKALAGTGDAQDASKVLREVLAQPGQARMMALNRDLLKACADTYSATTSVFNAYWKNMSRNASEAISCAYRIPGFK